jgi:hypothetical protein
MLELAEAEGSADGSAAITVPVARSTTLTAAKARALIPTRKTFLPAGPPSLMLLRPLDRTRAG